MDKYNSNEFITKIQDKIADYKCPICGNNHFTTPNSFGSISVQDSFSRINLGTSVPAGLLICDKCGHIDFIALGTLGLNPKNEGEK